MSTAPLEGITVVDLSRALAGPFCTALLADLGATIIKVESLGGDSARYWPPFEGGHSLYFDSVNRSKRSVCIDVYSDEGKDILRRLVRRADVLVENFKVGTLSKMGLDEATLTELNPELIVASVTGFGDRGPLRDAPGLDQVVQGMSGLMSVTGEDADHTYRVGVPIIDLSSGLTITISILAGLLGRARGVDVQRVSTSLLETGLALSAFQGQRALSLSEAATAQGNAHPSISPYGVFRTGSVDITIAAASDRHWRALCEVVGATQFVDDPRFLDERARLIHRDELTAALEMRLRAASAESWVDRLRAAGIPCGPIYDYSEALDTDQARALGIVQHVQRSDGSDLPLLRGPISIDGAAPTISSPPPLLGEHSAMVLTELGLGEQEIEELVERRIVHAPSGRMAEPTPLVQA